MRPKRVGYSRNGSMLQYPVVVGIHSYRHVKLSGTYLVVAVSILLESKRKRPVLHFNT